MVIDSHVHFWKYSPAEYPWIDSSMEVLRKNYLPQHIEPVFRNNHVDGCIAVQAATDEVETRFLAELASANPIVKGVVGWTDLRAPDAAKILSEFKDYPSIKGIRHIVQSEPDDFLYDEKFRNGLTLLADFGYTYDILIYPRQLRAAIDLVASFPQITFILDHCAKPAIRDREIASWTKEIRELAAHNHVSCKLSGLLTEARWKEWSPSDFYPYFDVLFEAFGPSRLLFGSDWPVMLLSGLYVQWKSMLEKYMENMLPEDRERVFGLNARNIYNL